MKLLCPLGLIILAIQILALAAPIPIRRAGSSVEPEPPDRFLLLERRISVLRDETGVEGELEKRGWKYKVAKAFGVKKTQYGEPSC